MKSTIWITGIVIIALIVGGIFVYSNYSKKQSNEWIISLGGGSGIPIPECVNPDNPNYVSDTARFIADIRINKINEVGNNLEYQIEILNWVKGETNLVPTSLKITREKPDPRLEDDASLSFLKEGKAYRINLATTEEGKPYVVCGNIGVKEISENI